MKSAYEILKSDKELNYILDNANYNLNHMQNFEKGTSGINYSICCHGRHHTLFVVGLTEYILSELSYDDHTIELGKVIQNNTLLEKAQSEHKPTVEAMRMTNELKRELEREDPNENFIISQIITIATEQYRGTTAQKELSEQIIKKKIRRIEIQQNFNSELFTVLVRYITLYEDGHIILHTKTDTDVGDTERI